MVSLARPVLVVDDEEGVRTLLQATLAGNGYKTLLASNGAEAMALGRATPPDAAIVDIKMPGMDGIDLSRALRAADPDLPVLIITAYADLETARQAIRLGAYDYIAKPFDLDDLILSVARGIERRALIRQNRAHQSELETKVEERTRQLCDAMVRLEGSFHDVQHAHLESIFVLSRVTELNDEYTGNHIRRVSSYCGEIAGALGSSPDFLEQLTYSSPMHDIGKISIPPAILSKPGKLTPDEFEIIKQHTVHGARILEGIPFLTMAREIALTHHERYDGSGYPRHLAGEAIPLSGRIVAIADVFDALISRRPYKDPYPFERAIEIMTEESGRHFDPRLLEVFLGLSGRIREIAEALADEQANSGSEVAPVLANVPLP